MGQRIGSSEERRRRIPDQTIQVRSGRIPQNLVITVIFQNYTNDVIRNRQL